MAGTEVEMADAVNDQPNPLSLLSRKFKTSDLPVSPLQGAAIDGLLYAFKKKGGFDLARKQIWAEFNEHVRVVGTGKPEGLSQTTDMIIDASSP
jgi:hypothetical protein